MKSERKFYLGVYQFICRQLAPHYLVIAHA